MKQIRKGVFETNSSSTHSICIAKDCEITIPSKIYFRFGEFGWEEGTLQSVEEKASYLYTGLINCKRESDFENVLAILEKYNINTECEKRGIDEGYIDHAGYLYQFLNDICSDEKKLLNFLFSDLSFILTGNDNSSSDVDIKVNYQHDKYFKGN